MTAIELKRVRLETADGAVLWLTAETEGLNWREVEQWQKVRCRVAGEPPRVLWTAKPKYATFDAWSEAFRVRALSETSSRCARG